MVKIDIKPLSVNEAFRGRRFKTPKHDKYIRDVLFMLPKANVPNNVALKLELEFGFSSKASDIDNCCKCFIDCVVKKYGVDDRNIYRLEVTKTIVPKGKEFIKFQIKSLNQ
jgi:Holliday junction resolvase RusA-like endonuclease